MKPSASDQTQAQETHDADQSDGVESPRPATESTGSSLRPRASLRTRPGPRRLSMIALTTALVGLSIIVGACVQQSRVSRRTFSLDKPRASTGLLSTEADDASLDRLVNTIQNASTSQAPQGALAPSREDIAFAMMAAGNEGNAVAVAANGGNIIINDQTSHDEHTGVMALAADARLLPPGAGKVIPLGRFSPTEISELIESLVYTFQMEHGYHEINSTDAIHTNTLGDLDALRILTRTDADNRKYELKFGFRSFASQPTQLSIVGIVASDDVSELTVNPDLDAADARAKELIASSQQMREGLTPSVLDRQIIQLSYIDAPGAATVLKGLGITVIDDAGSVPREIPFDTLPIVVKMPSPTKDQIGLVGSGAAGKGTFGLTVLPQAAGDLAPDTIMTPMSQLLVLYHPAHPEQLSHVRNLLNDVIDRPARQVFVEGLVLEISEDGLKELGVEWQFNEGPASWMIGKLLTGGSVPTLTFNQRESVDTARDWAVNIRALVREGRAEILSRPGVLTVDNRQATIRVGEDIPIATSQEGTSGNSNKLSFRFDYIPTGILLNIRPRITERGEEVSMLIDTVVSAVVPGRDLEIRSRDNEVLAVAPTVSTRRVQTYARVNNNSPYIIGGLVSRDMTVTKDKVPILGDLPWVGAAFRTERTENIKREVIIVLTPYVIPDDRSAMGPIPKGEPLFDSFGNALFQDTYRIRAEDVFDLSFLPENQRLKVYADLAEQAVRGDARLANVEPFSQFINGHIPGEESIVHRMIYEVIKRLDKPGEQLDLQKLIDANRIIYLEGQEIGGYSVQFLERVMTKAGQGTDYESFFENHPDKALAFTFHYDRESTDPAHLGTEPIPDVSIYDCPDRKTWGRLLWELNQPEADGRKRFTVLLNDESDLTRLRRAIVLKKVIIANGGWSQATLQNFKVGNVLRIPEMKPGQTTIIDVDVARLFFHTEHYYTATLKEIEGAIRQLDKDLRKPEIRPFLGDAILPETVPDPASLP